MNETAALYCLQADSLRKVADMADRRALAFSFNPGAQRLWTAIASSARRCAAERLDRARAVESV